MEFAAGLIIGVVGAAFALLVIWRRWTRRLQLLQRELNALRENERRSVNYAAIVDASDDGIISKTPDGIISSWNKGAERIFGYGAAEAFGQSILLIFPPDRLSEEADIQKRLRNGEHILPYETVRKRKNGELIDVEVTISPITDAQGRTVSISKTVRDVTARKRAEAAVQKTEERFHALLEAAPDGILSVDERGCINQVNERVKLMFGYEQSELIGAPVEMLIPPEQRQRHVEHRARYAVSPHRRDMGIGMELYAVRKDGSRFPVEVSLNPATTGEGAFVFCAVRDLSERHQVRRAQSESEARFKSAFNYSPIGIALVSPQGKWLQVNRSMSSILGYSEEELLTLDFQTVTHPDDLAPDLALLQRALDGEIETYQMEKRYFHKDGHIIYVLLGVSLVRDTAGSPLYFVSQVVDISGRKADEAQRTQLLADVQRANQDLQSFAYIISHDLKTPLRGISTVASWLTMDYGDRLDDAGKELLNLLSRRVVRLEDMITGVLNYSRAGVEAQASKPVDLGQLVAQTIDLLVPPAHIQIDIETPLPTVEGDPIRIQQVFQNLIDNAIKFMDKPDGRIRISCEQKETCWQFSISDNGPGIDARYHDKIFQIFQTLAPRDQAENTGIGLAIVKRIVERWRGQIWVTSEPGKGSTFIFTIPHSGTGAD